MRWQYLLSPPLPSAGQMPRRTAIPVPTLIATSAGAPAKAARLPRLRRMGAWVASQARVVGVAAGEEVVSVAGRRP
jgi:hypothetical protein